jgi:predicted ribosomally synthesized peptide with SipW-like signal peptide
MKRIFFSIGMIAFVASIVATSTGAFFSDTETSANNIFTAGSIDLRIDHSLSTYNGNAVVNDLVVVSDPSTTFVGDSPASGNAVNLSFVHPAWITIPGANWIWATNPVTDPATIDHTYTFTKTFNWSGPVVSASIDFGADNYYTVSVNGTQIADNQTLIVANFGSHHVTDVTALIVQGVNTITFVGKNQHIDNSTPPDNPAGIIFRLDVHGQTTFSDPIDLTGQPIWNFNDVKPADQGRDVLSTHVGTNDAWSCMQIGNARNNENDLIEPESSAGDLTPGVAGVGDGELGQYLQLFLWHDTNHDGVYNAPGETPVGAGIYTNVFNALGSTTIALHDSGTGNGALIASSTEYIGAAWCAGTIAADNTTGAITCDGSSVSNTAQTDSTLVDLGFYAVQQRNNPNFLCSSLNPNL